MILPLAYAFCNVPVMPLRLEPDHRSEQTSQLLFGEAAEVIEINNKDWAHIHCAWDGYKGWCKITQLAIVTNKTYQKELRSLAGGHTGKIFFGDDEMRIPLGSELRLKSIKMSANQEQGKYKGEKLIIKEAQLNAENVKLAALKFLNAPYQWGGRCIYGIDCSGLTQMAFKLCNHAIPRDAADQANAGELVDFLQNAKCGDLAFFDNKDARIVHVGLLLDNQTIIHATDTSGRVVIDKIDQGGIISVSLRKRTHNLRVVKRLTLMGNQE